MDKTYNGYTNYETWNFSMWEVDYLQESIQELQDQQDEKLEYGQVHEMVKGHIDNILEIIDTHQIATNIYDELELEGEC